MDVSFRIASRAIVFFASTGGKTGLTPAGCQSQFGLTHRVPSRRLQREGPMPKRGIVKSLSRVILPMILSAALAGCFDLSQNISIGRDGTGNYRVAVAAEGFVGQALKSKSDNDLVGGNHARTTTSDINGRVTRVSIVDFKSLSDLKLGEESMSIVTHGRGFFGFGSTHATFRYTFSVDRARRAHGSDSTTDDQMGKQVLAGILGNHSYSFTVTLPGSIEHIAPVWIGNTEIKPSVSGDFYHGHTIVWTMPIATLFSAKDLTFEVDYYAYGSFTDSHSQSTGSADF
jgi:hypothetical protein